MNKKIEKLAYWLAILMPISIAVEPNTLGEINFDLLSLLGFAYLFYNKDRKYLQEAWVKTFLVLLVYMLMRSLFAADVMMSLGILIQAIKFLLFLLALQFIVSNNPLAYKHLFYALLVATVFLMIEGFSQHFTGTSLILRRPILDEGYYHRLTGPYKRMIYGEIVAKFAAPIIAIGLFYLRNRKAAGIWYLMLGLAAFVVVCLSGERAALITFCLGLIVLIALSYNKELFTYNGVAALALSALSISGIIGLLIHKYPKVLARQIHSVIHTATNYTESIYGKLWIAALKIGATNPLFGVGGNHFKKYYCQYLDGDCTYKKPHGIYVEFFCDFGLIGLALFLYLIYCFGIKALRFCQANKRDAFTNFLLIGLCVGILQPLWPLPIRSLYRSWVAFPFWLTIGWALCIIETHKFKSHINQAFPPKPRSYGE